MMYEIREKMGFFLVSSIFKFTSDERNEYVNNRLRYALRKVDK